MNAQTEYYVRKYNNLLEQIKKLKHENKLLEDLTSGGFGDGGVGDDDDLSPTNPGSGSGSGPGSGSGSGPGSGSGSGPGSGSGSGPGSGSGSGPGSGSGRPIRPNYFYTKSGTFLKDVGLDNRKLEY